MSLSMHLRAIIAISLTVFCLFCFAGATMRAAIAEDAACGKRGEPACDPKTFPPKNIGAPNVCPDGTLYNPVGQSCWGCPDGYERPSGAISALGSCQKQRGIGRKPAQLIRRPPLCPNGSFLDIVEKSCFVCPKGYRRTLLPIGGGRGCQKPNTLDFTNAEDFGPPACPENGIVDLKTNKCYQCREGFKRDTDKPVDHIDACFKRLFVKALAIKISNAECPPNSVAADQSCRGCPDGASLSKDGETCIRQPCRTGLEIDERGHCQPPE